MPPKRTRSRKPRETEDETQQGIQVRARWENTERIPILFANHVFVRLQDDDFVVTFGQAELPYEVDLTDEMREKLRTEGLPIQVVARLAIPAEKISSVIEVLVNVHNQRLERQQRGEA